jgi:citrate lyase gamma subunit
MFREVSLKGSVTNKFGSLCVALILAVLMRLDIRIVNAVIL